ncbi:MAG: hypothetical protein JJE07_00445 [Flavobacteriaceae bacterium]|nr:hypothetical protein [Flavobacteriaceae bacterium]
MKTKATKQIGVWMNHSQAHFFGYKAESAFFIETIESPYESIVRVEGEGNDKTRFSPNTERGSNNEKRKHNIVQNELDEYFKILEGKLESYQEILLFGPGTAKEELFNRLSEKKLFKAKDIAVKSSDKLTENQMLSYVLDFFKA